MTDRFRLFGAAQTISYSALATVCAASPRPRQQSRRGEPGTADIVGRQQQIGREVGLAEWLALAACGPDPDLIGIEEVGAAMRPLDNAISISASQPSSSPGRQETDQTQYPRLVRGADRLRERFLVLRVEHVDLFRKICRCVRDQGAHVSAGSGIGSQKSVASSRGTPACATTRELPTGARLRAVLAGAASDESRGNGRGCRGPSWATSASTWVIRRRILRPSSSSSGFLTSILKRCSRIFAASRPHIDLHDVPAIAQRRGGQWNAYPLRSESTQSGNAAPTSCRARP